MPEMRVPMLNLHAQYERIREDVQKVVLDVLDSQHFRGGPYVEQLEQEIAARVGVSDAVGVATGTDALLLLLKAVGVTPGDEVITTPFTFFATAGAIVTAGATPVFVDIDPLTYNVDTGRMAEAVTERTRVLLPVHIFGQCADMDPILELAADKDLTVIEDAAQALDAQYKGRPACSMGAGGAISFYPTKNLGAAGEGGMAASRDKTVADRIRLLRSHGAGAVYMHELVGTNSHLHAIQAAVLTVKLRHLNDWTRRRQEVAAYYNEQLSQLDEVQTPLTAEGNEHVWHQYVIRLPRRDEARRRLQEQGIGCNVFYPLPLHQQECFQEHIKQQPDCPEAERASREVLALPIYPELTQAQQDLVISAVKKHLTRQ